METNTISSPIQFSQSAIVELKQILAKEQKENLFLRIGVKGGGCSGLSYVVEMDTIKDNDDQFQVDGLSYIIDKSHQLYLYGMSIDWDNGLNNRGFMFNNPNATKTCGCGSSFAI
ncbi:MAG: iron-sulfur cluster assembly accessory protein [Phycisphaerales bacterium]|nr:iron-sulfur cluster assembly accessory protein [Phycisphaerales bacterium]